MARPAEVDKSSRFLVLASVCVVVAALYFAREVLIPLALAILISFLLAPIVTWLERFRMSRTFSALLVVVLVGVLVGSVGYLVYRQAVSIVEQLPIYHAQLSSKIKSLKGHGNLIQRAEHEIKTFSSSPDTQPVHVPLSQVGGTLTAAPAGAARSGQSAPPTFQPTVDNPVPVRIVAEAPTPIEMIGNYGSSLLSPLATSGLVLILIIFMLLDREDLRDRMIRLLGHGRLNLTTQALDEAASRITRYLNRLAIVNGAYGLLTAGGLWLIGRLLGQGMAFPNVLGWGILVGLLRFVPYIGIWIGAGLPLMLSFALFPGNGVFLATLGMFVALEVVVSQFLEPMWYGASTGMTPLAVLVAAVFWTWLWGPMGLLLSTPLTVCLVVMGKHVPQLQFIDILLRDKPVLEPFVRLYQRLIAGDEEEAAELAYAQLADRSLEQVFDQVLMPALAMAVQDRHRRQVDSERFDLVIAGMRDIVEELGDREQAAGANERSAAIVEKAKDREGPGSQMRHARLNQVPAGCSINVLCLPARDTADEIAAMMLSRLLELRGYCAKALGSTLLAGEMIERLSREQTQIVCVLAMPPAAVAHARYLCKRLSADHNDLPVVIGLWTAKVNLDRARERIACDAHVKIVTTLADAQDQVEQFAQPLVLGATSDAR